MVYFKAFFGLLSPLLPVKSKLSKFQQILLFLMKLRLNLVDQDVAYGFGVHRTRNFRRVLKVAYAKPAFLIQLPERYVLRLIHCQCLSDDSSKIVVLLLIAQKCSWSNQEICWLGHRSGVTRNIMLL